ncbi:GH116 family glycosyl hydrolase [Chitinophaga alhagiae]|uniref:GH116 family glycosyl hydrolase n=1 Tax=Chitinophaga alhagiae TaxID=2203219 RepID=UPI000E5BB044|nr:GH116 family glycosyl hydrolase [Chitinophaga alhagiae]
MQRRNFLKHSGLLGFGLLAAELPVWGAFARPPRYPEHNIPADKMIDPAWLRSLRERGEPAAYLKSRNELRYIGMPAGGLHAGTVYLGGDGRLWLWQVYNESMEPTHEGIDPKLVLWNDGTQQRKIRPRDGAAYVEPAIAGNKRVLEQGFAVQVIKNGTKYIKELNEDQWDEIRFEPAYPAATITYTAKNFPVKVQLNAYAPFIPLDEENSGLPVTILRVAVTNLTGEALDVSLLGWLENGANKLTAKNGNGKKRCSVSAGSGAASLFFDFAAADAALATAQDAGSMSLCCHHAGAKPLNALAPWPVTAACFDAAATPGMAETDGGEKQVGGIICQGHVTGEETFRADYTVAWHFNHPHPKLKKLVKDAEGGYWYGSRFKNAQEVDRHVAENLQHLVNTTELWRQTWNNSTLPHWFLERTFVNIGTLATANTYRFSSGRFWAWEGVGACAGTCTHVWQYAQSMARIFPALERDQRQRVDLGAGFREDSGAIIFRAENESRPAIDGQAGTVLRFYREHQMSANNSFLHTNWPRIKKAVQFMLAQDKNGDGMTDTPMENTLDAVWEGEIAWIVGLCIAAAGAAGEMAAEMGDKAFAKICNAYVEKGRANMEAQLFNGEYFIHRPDAIAGRKKLGSYNTCHIDQVYGQSWAFQVGLPRMLNEEKTKAALKALWKYNFTMDVGPYIKTHTGGRPYALAGEGGMVMNTNPKNEAKPYGEDVTWQLGYFHECMSGFEHQVAAHMMAEGMVDESLALTRVIHDRYHAAKRNPFNEIECSDHYARAMASYGTYINACGYTYHGPKGKLGFAPRIHPENFRAAFTAAEGWGTYSQQQTAGGQQHQVSLAYGTLRLSSLSFEAIGGRVFKNAEVMVNGKKVNALFKQEGARVLVSLKGGVLVRAREAVAVNLT